MRLAYDILTAHGPPPEELGRAWKLKCWRARRAAWEVYLDAADACGLLDAEMMGNLRRFQPDQFAGTAIALGNDNRSCAFRLVGRGPSYRVENRIPGADVNPYYAYSATIAAGLDGIDRELPVPDIFDGNAWTGDNISGVPTSLHEALRRFEEAKMLRAAFGDEVFDHLLASTQAELVAFDVMEPALRSRGNITDRAKTLYGQADFCDQMKALFTSTPAGVLVLPTLREAIEKIAVLEERVRRLEERMGPSE